MDTELTFSPRTEAMLARAAALCESRGARLTELRRDVLGLILEAQGPAGAYDLLDRLRARRGPAAPPTVYRALDFLLAQGFVHRIERLAAFVGCLEDAGHAHGAQFLICRNCGSVREIEDAGLAAALAAAARAAGFTVGRATIEAEGLCAACAASTARGGEEVSGQSRAAR
jgi:Fur family zinc uptake transcriptional regulator